MAEPPPALIAASATRLPDLDPAWQPVTRAILSDGTLAVLATDVDLAGEQRRIHAAIMASKPTGRPHRLARLAESGTARVWTMTDETWVEGTSFPLETPYPSFDRFSDGRWLVAAGRSRGGTNARVLAHDGTTLSRLTLGDGIWHLAVDAADRIWVGWFDEGVFGNGDWAVPGREWPPSSDGVACFGEDGTILPSQVWPKEVEPIADCYAMNTTGPGVWVCTYGEFPLVRLVPGSATRWWRTGLAGVEAIAIDGDHALLAGGYGEDAARLALVALDGRGAGEQVRLLGTWALPMTRLPPSDKDRTPVWDRPTLLAGRGKTLHMVQDDLWQRWQVHDLVGQVGR